MLEPDELTAVTTAYGVAAEQVRRDHLISHVLAALANLDLPIVFFGGTALARTYLTESELGARLSEDIDLCADHRRKAATVLDEQLPRHLRREFPGSQWDPPLRSVKSVEPGQLVTREGLRVRIQLLDSREHHELTQWPTEIRQVTTRYRDVAGPVSLRVPTMISAAAMKTVAWMDRHAARDLYDLNGLAKLGALTCETADLVRQVTGWRVAPHSFDSLPSLDWDGQLAHQTRTLPSAESCLERVREAYGDSLNWQPRPDPFA